MVSQITSYSPLTWEEVVGIVRNFSRIDVILKICLVAFFVFVALRALNQLNQLFDRQLHDANEEARQRLAEGNQMLRDYRQLQAQGGPWLPIHDTLEYNVNTLSAHLKES